MIVYWDLVIISNLIVDYTFLKTIAILYQVKISKVRMLLSLIIGILSLWLFVIPIRYIYNFRYVVGILMGMIAYQTNRPLQKLLLISSFYLLNLSFIGCLVIFKINNSLLFIVIMVSVLILTIIEFIGCQKHRPKEYEYMATINQYQLRGLLDTGNGSLFCLKPIVFLDIRFQTDEFKNLGETEVNTIGGKSKIKIFTGPVLIINHQSYDVIYSFSKLYEYDLILNCQMEERLNDSFNHQIN